MDLTVSDIRDLAPSMFGVTANAFYSPSQATGLPAVSHSKVAIQWICILADEIIHAMGGRERTNKLYRQRAQGYQSLKIALRRRNECFEEALLGIVIAGLVEYSFGDARAQSLHTIAADMLIHSKGSIEAAFAACTHLEPFYIAAQYAFGRCRIPSLENLGRITAAWIQDVQGVLMTTKPADRQDCEVQLPDRQSHIFHEYTTLERELVHGVFESLKVEDPSSFAVGMQVMLVNEAVSALLEFGCLYSLAIRFFKRIKFIVQHSMLGEHDNIESVELRAGTLASIFSRARNDVLRDYQPEELPLSNARIVKMHINSLKSFGYLKPEGQELVISRLKRWLVKSDGGISATLTAEEISDLLSQAQDTWKQLYSS